MNGLSCGVICVILRLAVSIRYRSVTHTHTHTHTETDRHTTTAYTALSKASRGVCVSLYMFVCVAHQLITIVACCRRVVERPPVSARRASAIHHPPVPPPLDRPGMTATPHWLPSSLAILLFPNPASPFWGKWGPVVFEGGGTVTKHFVRHMFKYTVFSHETNVGYYF